MQPDAGPYRLVRALLVALACVGVSLSAHVSAGGMMPPDGLLAAVWVAAAVLAYGLSGRRWTFGRLLVLLGGGQVVLHPAFYLAQGGSAMSGPMLSMALAHAGAAAVLAALLAYGDRALWRMLALVAALLAPIAQLVSGASLGVVPAVATPVRPAAAVPLDLPRPLGVVAGPRQRRAPPR